MSEQWVKTQLDVEMEYCGFEAQFYGQPDKQTELPLETIEEFEKYKENAKIFIRRMDDITLNAQDLISQIGRTDRLKPENCISEKSKQHALDHGRAVHEHTMTVDLPENSFYMSTTDGPRDLKVLKFIIRFTITQKMH